MMVMMFLEKCKATRFPFKGQDVIQYSSFESEHAWFRPPKIAVHYERIISVYTFHCNRGRSNNHCL